MRQSVKDAAQIIKRRTHNKVQPKLMEGAHDWDWNCWGFTALAHGWVKNPLWLDQEDMEHYLKSKTEMILDLRKLKTGDIVVFRDPEFGNLEHTAIILDPKYKKILHKDGTYPIETNFAGNVYTGSIVEFVRIKERK